MAVLYGLWVLASGKLSKKAKAKPAGAHGGHLVPFGGRSFFGFRPKLKFIQSRMAQKQVLKGEVGTRAWLA